MTFITASYLNSKQVSHEYFKRKDACSVRACSFNWKFNYFRLYYKTYIYVSTQYDFMN